MLRSAIFDIDNTLYDYNAAHALAYAALSDWACRAFALTPEQFDALHRHASRTLEARCGGGAAIHNRLIRYQLMLEHIGRPIAHAPEMAERYWSTLLDEMRPFPGAVEAFARLRAMGLLLGIGTNMTADRQFSKLERLGLMDMVDFMVSSEEAGAEKPDRRLFDLCAMKAGCPAAACAFVGDSVKGDVLGAMNAGMRAVWFCPDNDMGDAIPGAIPVHSLAELPQRLASL